MKKKGVISMKRDFFLNKNSWETKKKNEEKFRKIQKGYRKKTNDKKLPECNWIKQKTNVGKP